MPAGSHHGRARGLGRPMSSTTEYDPIPVRLPRGRCPICGADVALRKGGLVREHRVYLPQREQDLSTPLGRTTVCAGSGLPSSDR